MGHIFLIRQNITQGIDKVVSPLFTDAANGIEESTFKSLFEAAKRKYSKTGDVYPHVIDQVKATHLGYINGNNSYYPFEFGDANAKSWTAPYEKPVLTNHDLMGQPLGRVFDAAYVPFALRQDQMKNLRIPKGVVVTHAAITDEDAMKKVLDGRFLTVSISATSDAMLCSVCDQNWLETDYADRCEHVPGQKYEGKLCFKKTGKLSYTERSFVNEPADQSKGHYAGVSAYELMLPTAQDMRDEAYIVKNMLYSKESPMIVDSSGYTLFLSQDNQSLMKNRPLFAFSSNRMQTIDDSDCGCTECDCDKTAAPEPTTNIAPTTENVDTAQAHLPETTPHASKVVGKDITTSVRKERRMLFEKWDQVPVADALANVVGLKEHVETLVSQKAQDMANDAVQRAKDAEVKVSDLEKSNATLKDGYDKVVADAKTLAVHTILALQAQLEKPAYMKLVAAHKDDQDGMLKAMNELLDELKKRELNSLMDTVSDLREELALVSVAEDSSTEEAPAATDTALTQPAGTGITEVADGKAGNVDATVQAPIDTVADVKIKKSKSVL